MVGKVDKDEQSRLKAQELADKNMKADRKKAFDNSVQAAKGLARQQEIKSEVTAAREKKIEEYKLKGQQAWDELNKTTIPGLLEGGMKGYDDWVSGMCKIWAGCCVMHRAVYYSFTMRKVEPETAQLAVWWARAKDKVFGEKTELPDVTCDLEQIKIDKDGVVDLSTFEPAFNGDPFRDYFPPGAKAQVDECNQHLQEGFKLWLNVKGYTLDESDPNKPVIYKTEDMTKKTYPLKALTQQELGDLNENGGVTLVDFMSGRLGRTVNPAPESDPPVGPTP